jgi:hypothetical protein
MSLTHDSNAISTGFHQRDDSAIPENQKLNCYLGFDAYFEPELPLGKFSQLWDKAHATMLTGKEPDVGMYLARYPKYVHQVWVAVMGAIETGLLEQFDVLEAEVKSGHYLLDPLARDKPPVPDEVEMLMEYLITHQDEPKVPTS